MDLVDKLASENKEKLDELKDKNEDEKKSLEEEEIPEAIFIGPDSAPEVSHIQNFLNMLFKGRIQEQSFDPKRY